MGLYMNPLKLRSSIVTAIVLLSTAATVASAGSPVPDAFSSSSYWNTPIGTDATVDPNSDAMIDFLVADNDLNGCITLAGYPGNSWGMPTFVADAADTVYNVTTRKRDVPPEFSSLRIPHGAVAADTSDGEMVVYDPIKGVVAQLSKAVYSSATDSWTVSGGSVAYLDSNGLIGSLPESDEPRNTGTFRGYPASSTMVHYDDVADGKLDNVVKVAINTANSGFVFPMIGSDGDTSNPNAPRQGTRIRIRSDVNLAALGLSGHALTIARGLQEYGMIVGDSSGGAIVLKLEDTIASGRGDLWDLKRDSLCAIRGEHLEVLASPGTAPAPSPTDGFSDISGHTFEADIKWLVATGLTSGCGSNRFCPDDAVTRGQMAAFLARALELKSAPSAGFTDTDGSIFEENIDRLYASGITRGCAADRFCPGRLVTRGEMAAFLVRGFRVPTTNRSTFTDISDSIFSAEIESLAATGITRGCGQSVFCPSAPVTRGQMAAFLKRAMEG